MDAHHEQVQHAELLTGIVAAEILNNSMCRPTKRAVPKDFMPSYWTGKPEKRRAGSADRKQTLQNFDAFIGSMRSAGRVVTVNRG